ncbi:MAG: efflux RND transporter permease subunit, partial [Vicinamibacterales bacterium]
MNPVRLAARHSRVVVLVTLLMAAAGAYASTSLPSDIYPPLQFPRILAIAHSGMTPAQAMMLTVTRPIEQAAMEVPGIRRVRSRTFRGATEVSAQFDPTTDMVVALQQVQNRIAEIRPDLPDELDLVVERLTPTAFPFFTLDLTGGLSSADLRDYGFYVIRPALARVEGVGRVEILASDTREIEVIADPRKLLSANLTVDDVAAALKSANALAPVGRFTENGTQHLVLASGLWESAGAIGETPVVVRNGAPVRVRDLADVTPGAPDRTVLVVGAAGDAATVTISQQLGANILRVREGVEAALESLKTSLPAGLKLTKTYDLAEFVENAIANVRDAILIGGVLAVLVLLIFLRNWRLTIIAASTLPLTVLITFFFMRLFGESINLMSMGGLAVAIGLVIDDAVVVVENIHRRLHEPGEDVIEQAATELIGPVVGSTLTTVVVFAPLSLLSGVVGQFFRALSLTLSVAVLVSLVLSLTLIPLLARALYRRRGAPAQVAADPAAEHHGRLERAYVATLPAWLRRPAIAAIALVVLGAAAVVTFRAVGTGFLPAADEGGFVIDYLTPSGSALEETDARLRKIDDILRKNASVATFSRRTGSELGMFATQQNTGDILVRLKPRGQRDQSAEEVIEELRDQLAEAEPDTEIEFLQLLQDMLGDLEGNPDPIEVKIFGDDPATLAGIAEQVEPLLEKIDGVVDVVGPSLGNPEVTWRVDPVQAGRIGLTVEQVTQQLSSAWAGNVATDLRLLDRSIPVRVRYPDAFRANQSQMSATMVRGADGALTSASTLATITRDNGQEELLRENLRQMAMVTARLENRDLGSAVAEIRTALATVQLPVGYTSEVGGQYASQRQAFREMLVVFAIASALVFVILVAQFRRFTAAVLILAAAPLSLSGAFALLIVTGTDLNVSSAMGLILLIGLVVKNGIVLLDFAERRHVEGVSMEEAMLAAARVRLRPILMTTLCTLFGLLPLALGLGAGAELQKPLALAVIGGLSLSTLVTLYLVPSAYVALQ